MSVDFEERVRAGLHEALGPGPPVEDSWADIDGRARRALRRRRTRGAGIGAAVVAMIVLAGLVVAASRGHDVEVQLGPVAPGSVETSVPPTTAPGVQVASSTELGTDQVDAVVATPDGAWVSLWGTGLVVRVDRSGVITARVPIGSVQNGPLAMAAGEGSIWVLDFSTTSLVRIDPATATETGRVKLPAEAERIAVGNGKVWVTACCDRTTPNQRLYRINPQSMAIEHELALPGDGESEEVGVLPTGLFVAGEGFSTVVHIDPTGTRILDQTDVHDPTSTVRDPCLLAVAMGVWCSVGSTNQVAIIGADDKATFMTPPAPVSAVAVLGDHLLVSTSQGLYLLQSGTGTWDPLGGPGGLGPLDYATDLWAVQGTKLLRLSLP